MVPQISPPIAGCLPPPGYLPPRPRKFRRCSEIFEVICYSHDCERLELIDCTKPHLPRHPQRSTKESHYESHWVNFRLETFPKVIDDHDRSTQTSAIGRYQELPVRLP